MLFWVLALLETEHDANFKTARSVCSRAEEENQRQNGEPKPSQTAVLKGFMSLSSPRLYEKLDFCWLFQITLQINLFLLQKELNHMHCGIIPICAAVGGGERLPSPSEE